MQTQGNLAVKAAGTKVITGMCRASYAHLFTAYAGIPGTEPKFSVCLLIPKTDKKTVAAINGAIQAATEDGKTRLWKGKVPAGLKNPLRDGDEEKPDDANYAGMYFINVSSKKKPGVVDASMNEIIDPNELVSGDWIRASINAFPYEAVGNKGISFGLNNVQLVKKGEPLGGKTRAQDDFSAIETEEEDF